MATRKVALEKNARPPFDPAYSIKIIAGLGGNSCQTPARGGTDEAKAYDHQHP